MHWLPPQVLPGPHGRHGGQPAWAAEHQARQTSATNELAATGERLRSVAERRGLQSATSCRFNFRSFTVIRRKLRIGWSLKNSDSSVPTNNFARFHQSLSAQRFREVAESAQTCAVAERLPISEGILRKMPDRRGRPIVRIGTLSGHSPAGQSAIHADLWNNYCAAQDAYEKERTMRICAVAVSALLTWIAASCPASEPPAAAAIPTAETPLAWALLRDAAEIALKQDAEQAYWTERVLLRIGQVQIRARDFAGAERSLRGSAYDYGRYAGLAHLAEALARDGQYERAQELVRGLKADDGNGWSYLADVVQLWRIENLIASGKRDAARKATEDLGDGSNVEAWRALAVASAKSGEAAEATDCFQRAIGAAAKLPGDFARAQELWKTAEAQLAVGQIDVTRATIRQLIEGAQIKDPWARVAALRETAGLSVKANDHETAQRLFRQALESCDGLDARNKVGARCLVGIAQAGAGQIQAALATAALILNSPKTTEHEHDAKHDHVLFAVASAQLQTKDADAAVRTAMSVRRYFQYRDDALTEVVDYLIRKQDLGAAYAAAQKMDNGSTKAVAVLKIAAEHARSGGGTTARELASRIELTPRDSYRQGRSFDYRLPASWVVRYEPAFTLVSADAAMRQAAQVAVAGLTLAHALEENLGQPYLEAFADAGDPVIEALARAHTVLAGAGVALNWAGRIGSDRKPERRNDSEADWAIGRRVHALIGVAEGVLNRNGVPTGLPEQ